MNIKSRIWSLPVISVIIFSIGIAVSSYFANKAQGTIERTGKVDYAMLSQSQILRTDVQALADDLKNAVMEGDKKRLDSVDDNVSKLNAKFAAFTAIPGQQAAGARLAKEFNAYAVQGKRTARVMLEVETGDTAAEIAGMQKTFNTIAEDLDARVVHRALEHPRRARELEELAGAGHDRVTGARLFQPRDHVVDVGHRAEQAVVVGARETEVDGGGIAGQELDAR